MTDTRYRSRSRSYAVSGSSALAYDRYSEEERRMPAYEQHISMRAPAPRRQEKASARTLTMVVALSVVFAVLCGVSLSKSAANSAIQRQITAAQKEIQKTAAENQLLEQQLIASTDGEQIRNYVVNTLGMSKIRAEDIFTITLPNSRPLGDSLASGVQKKQEESGFFAMLADLLRQIPI